MKDQKPTPNTTTAATTLIERRWLKLMVIVTQILTWIIVQPILPMFIRKRSIALQVSDVEHRKDTLISANHQSRIDPFLVVCILPFRTFIKLLPYRFFAYNGLFNTPLRPFLLLHGCFPASTHPKWSSGIGAAEHLLRDKQTVFIFPEGKRVSYASKPARSGVGIIAQNNPNLRLIPVNILWTAPGWWRKCEVTIARPESVKGLNASDILDRTYSLRPDLKS